MAKHTKALFERLKNATGPDRILDRDIARLVTGKPHDWRHPCMSAWGKGVPHYTQSFEAAITLLPPRWAAYRGSYCFRFTRHGREHSARYVADHSSSCPQENKP